MEDQFEENNNQDTINLIDKQQDKIQIKDNEEGGVVVKEGEDIKRDKEKDNINDNEENYKEENAKEVIKNQVNPFEVVENNVIEEEKIKDNMKKGENVEDHVEDNVEDNVDNVEIESFKEDDKVVNEKKLNEKEILNDEFKYNNNEENHPLESIEKDDQKEVDKVDIKEIESSDNNPNNLLIENDKIEANDQKLGENITEDDEKENNFKQPEEKEVEEENALKDENLYPPLKTENNIAIDEKLEEIINEVKRQTTLDNEEEDPNTNPLKPEKTPLATEMNIDTQAEQADVTSNNENNNEQQSRLVTLNEEEANQPDSDKLNQNENIEHVENIKSTPISNNQSEENKCFYESETSLKLYNRDKDKSLLSLDKENLLRETQDQVNNNEELKRIQKIEEFLNQKIQELEDIQRKFSLLDENYKVLKDEKNTLNIQLNEQDKVIEQLYQEIKFLKERFLSNLTPSNAINLDYISLPKLLEKESLDPLSISSTYYKPSKPIIEIQKNDLLMINSTYKREAKITLQIDSAEAFHITPNILNSDNKILIITNNNIQTKKYYFDPNELVISKESNFNVSINLKNVLKFTHKISKLTKDNKSINKESKKELEKPKEEEHKEPSVTENNEVASQMNNIHSIKIIKNEDLYYSQKDSNNLNTANTNKSNNNAIQMDILKKFDNYIKHGGDKLNRNQKKERIILKTDKSQQKFEKTDKPEKLDLHYFKEKDKEIKSNKFAKIRLKSSNDNSGVISKPELNRMNENER